MDSNILLIVFIIIIIYQPIDCSSLFKSSLLSPSSALLSSLVSSPFSKDYIRDGLRVHNGNYLIKKEKLPSLDKKDYGFKEEDLIQFLAPSKSSSFVAPSKESFNKDKLRVYSDTDVKNIDDNIDDNRENKKNNYKKYNNNNKSNDWIRRLCKIYLRNNNDKHLKMPNALRYHVDIDDHKRMKENGSTDNDDNRIDSYKLDKCILEMDTRNNIRKSSNKYDQKSDFDFIAESLSKLDKKQLKFLMKYLIEKLSSDNINTENINHKLFKSSSFRASLPYLSSPLLSTLSSEYIDEDNDDYENDKYKLLKQSNKRKKFLDTNDLITFIPSLISFSSEDKNDIFPFHLSPKIINIPSINKMDVKSYKLPFDHPFTPFNRGSMHFTPLLAPSGYLGHSSSFTPLLPPPPPPPSEAAILSPPSSPIQSSSHLPLPLSSSSTSSRLQMNTKESLWDKIEYMSKQLGGHDFPKYLTNNNIMHPFGIRKIEINPITGIKNIERHNGDRELEVTGDPKTVVVNNGEITVDPNGEVSHLEIDGNQLKHFEGTNEYISPKSKLSLLESLSNTFSRIRLPIFAGSFSRNGPVFYQNTGNSYHKVNDDEDKIPIGYKPYENFGSKWPPRAAEKIKDKQKPNDKFHKFAYTKHAARYLTSALGSLANYATGNLMGILYAPFYKPRSASSYYNGKKKLTTLEYEGEGNVLNDNEIKDLLNESESVDNDK